MIDWAEHNRIITTDEIIAATEKVFDIKFSGEKRHANTTRVVQARTVAMSLCMEIQKFSRAETGERFGRSGAVTVMHAERRLEASPELQRMKKIVKSRMGLSA